MGKFNGTTGSNQERIICAAIWYKELPTNTMHNPINIFSGLVVCGHRHHNCIDIVARLSGLRTVQIAPDGVGETIEGFMTSNNRFVDRLEAAEIAVKRGQVYRNFLHNPKIGLFSEDLY
jgi:hypothetical protein